MDKDYTIIGIKGVDNIDAFGVPYTPIECEALGKDLKYYLIKLPVDKVKTFADKSIDYLSGVPEKISEFTETFRESLDNLLFKEDLPRIHAVHGYVPLCSGGGPPVKSQIKERDSKLEMLFQNFQSIVKTKKAELVKA